MLINVDILTKLIPLVHVYCTCASGINFVHNILRLRTADVQMTAGILNYINTTNKLRSLRTLWEGCELSS